MVAVIKKELTKCTPDEILDMALPDAPLISVIGHKIEKKDDDDEKITVEA